MSLLKHLLKLELFTVTFLFSILISTIALVTNHGFETEVILVSVFYPPFLLFIKLGVNLNSYFKSVAKLDDYLKVKNKLNEEKKLILLTYTILLASLLFSLITIIFLCKVNIIYISLLVVLSYITYGVFSKMSFYFFTLDVPKLFKN